MASTRQLAADVRDALTYLYVWHRAAHEEVERVHDIGYPLAKAINDGYIHALTASGTDHLQNTRDDLVAMVAVLKDCPDLGERQLVDLKGEKVMSWIPLWDAVSEAVRKSQS